LSFPSALIGIIENLFSQRGLIIKKATADEHDEAMKYVQVLTHFTYLVFSGVMAKNEKQLRNLLDFRTPPFTILTAFAGRIIGSPHTTYVNIQKHLDGAS
jgi:prephenate dehydrogenase